jgi:hypothetical protein
VFVRIYTLEKLSVALQAHFFYNKVVNITFITLTKFLIFFPMMLEHNWQLFYFQCKSSTIKLRFSYMCISTLCFKINFYVLEYFMSCFNLKTHPYFTGVLQKYRFSHKGFADIKSLKTASVKHLTFMYFHRFLLFVTMKHCSLHLKVMIKNFMMPI